MTRLTELVQVAMLGVAMPVIMQVVKYHIHQRAVEMDAAKNATGMWQISVRYAILVIFPILVAAFVILLVTPILVALYVMVDAMHIVLVQLVMEFAILIQVAILVTQILELAHVIALVICMPPVVVNVMEQLIDGEGYILK